MAMAATTTTLDLRARDLSGQRRYALRAVPRERTVAELVKDLIGRMNLVDTDGAGRPLAYRARLDREGRQLHGAERVGDALQSDDELVITPFIYAG